MEGKLMCGYARLPTSKFLYPWHRTGSGYVFRHETRRRFAKRKLQFHYLDVSALTEIMHNIECMQMSNKDFITATSSKLHACLCSSCVLARAVLSHVILTLNSSVMNSWVCSRDPRAMRSTWSLFVSVRGWSTGTIILGGIVPSLFLIVLWVIG